MALIKSPYAPKKRGRPQKNAPAAKNSPYKGNYDHDAPRADAWDNMTSGLGESAYDKTMNTMYLRDYRVDDDQLSGLYYGNDIAKLIVDSKVEESFRVGYEINLPDDADNSDKDELEVWKPAIDTAVRDLRRWGNLFGGAAIYLDVEDNSDLLEPLDVKKVKKINSLRVFDRRYVWPLGYDTDPTSPTYWLPEYYGFGGSLAGALQTPRVHHSRLLRAVGLEADRREAQYLFWWGHSVLQPVYRTLLNLGLAEQTSIVMMQDATQFIYYVKGLLDAIAAGDAAAIQGRYLQIDQARGANRALLLDAGQTGTDGEKVEKLTTPFTGVYDLLTFFQSRVSAAARIPVSVLFGTGFHGGLSDKGEGDLRIWHASIQAYQVREIEPDLRRLYALVGQVLGIDTSKLKFVWKPLYEPTAAEQALVYFQMAQGDEIYMNAGALRPEEVTISRFGSGKYSLETTVDVDLYRASLIAAPSPVQAAPPGQPPAPAPGQAPPGAPSAPGQPPSKGAALAVQPAGPGAPVAEKPEINAANNQKISKPSPTEGQLAPGEVGGSNKMTEPQIVDVTGRGTPKAEQTPNKLPPDASGVKPDDTPVQGKPVGQDKTPLPSTDNQVGTDKVKPAGSVHVKAGDIEVKIKK